MARSYLTPGGRVIRRSGNGRFRQTTLRDFGIGDDQLQNGQAVCDGCGYGENEYWLPIMKAGICPKCGSKEKHDKYNPCAVCGQQFSDSQWEERHSTEEGEDCHEHCCPFPECNHVNLTPRGFDQGYAPMKCRP